MSYGTRDEHNLSRVQQEKLNPSAILHQRNSGSSARELLQPGKTVRDLLMRTVFKDENRMKSAILFIDWARRHDCDENLILDYMAGAASVDGRRRKEFSLVATGIIAPLLWGHGG